MECSEVEGSYSVGEKEQHAKSSQQWCVHLGLSVLLKSLEEI